MNKLLITAVCAAMAFPAVSAADDHKQGKRPSSYQHRDNDGNHAYNTGGRYPHYVPYYVQSRPHYTYRSYPPYYYGHSYPYYYGHNHHDGNDDDALWAIGGLVVGAIIGNAVANAPTAGPPQQNCDHVAYDSAGNPYVERRCAK